MCQISGGKAGPRFVDTATARILAHTDFAKHNSVRANINHAASIAHQHLILERKIA
jgi:hypothetical protein